MSRSVQFVLFFSIVLTLLGLMQWYVASVYRRWVFRAMAESGQRWMRGAAIVLIVANGLLLVSFLGRGMGFTDHPLLRTVVVYPAGMWFAAVILAFILIGIGDIFRLVLFWVRHGIRVLERIARQDSTTVPVEEVIVSEPRRRFLKVAGSAAITAIVATPVAASLATARDYQIRRIPLYFPNLPTELDGFTVAQVSDIHSGVYMSESDMRHIFEITNALQPHVTVVTGDLVDTVDAEIPPLHAALKGLRAERGVYGILGNHDHFATADRVAAAAQDAGVRMLRNEHAILRVDGARLALVGVDDPTPRRNHANLPAALSGLDPDAFRIMLVHQPRFWPDAKAADMDLTLVGHTHGGQIGVEMMGMKLYPVYLAYDHPMGHYIEDGKQLYVNVGVGMVATPIRLVRPEIALFTLHRGEPVKFVPRST